jgi:hypothetical protein
MVPAKCFDVAHTAYGVSITQRVSSSTASSFALCAPLEVPEDAIRRTRQRSSITNCTLRLWMPPFRV